MNYTFLTQVSSKFDGCEASRVLFPSTYSTEVRSVEKEMTVSHSKMIVRTPVSKGTNPADAELRTKHREDKRPLEYGTMYISQVNPTSIPQNNPKVSAFNFKNLLFINIVYIDL